MSFLTDFWDQAYFFFTAPAEYDAKMRKKGWKEGTSERMRAVIELVQGIRESGGQGRVNGESGNSGTGSREEGISAEDYESVIKEWITENELGMGAVMNPLRLALVGAPKGPGVFDIMEVLGKEEVIKRIQKAITTLG